MRIALGSVAELATNVEAGLRLGYWDTATAKKLDAEFTRVNKLLNGVLRSIWKQLLAEAAGCAGITYDASLTAVLFNGYRRSGEKNNGNRN